MTDQTATEIAMSPTELGLFMAINALSLALKASPGFNNEALKVIAQKFLNEPSSVVKGEAAMEAYERSLRSLVNDQEQVMDWLKQNGVG